MRENTDLDLTEAILIHLGFLFDGRILQLYPNLRDNEIVFGPCSTLPDNVLPN
jgi:hypothetical protein